MKDENYESSYTLEEENMEPIDGVPIEAMLDSEEVQSKFAGYYFDGRATPEATKQIEHIMISSKP